MPTRRDTRFPRARKKAVSAVLMMLTGLWLAGCDKIKIPEVVQQAAAPAPVATPAAPAAAAPVAPVAATPEVPQGKMDHKELVKAFYAKSKSFALTDRDIIEVTKEGEPGDFDEVKELRLSGAEITDAGVSKLGKFTKLTTLDLSSSKATVEGMQVIKQLPELEYIGLSSTTADDRILVTIGSHPSIKEVALSSTGITDFGINELEKLNDLESLDISHTGVTGKGFEKFKGHKNLKKLVAHHSGLQSEALKFLANCPIETLEIDQAGVGDAGMRYIGQMKKMKRLSMSFSSISDLGIKQMGTLKDLEYINVRNDAHISRFLFQKLMPCKNLKYVNVNGTLISATDCAALMKLKPGCEVVN